MPWFPLKLLHYQSILQPLQRWKHIPTGLLLKVALVLFTCYCNSPLFSSVHKPNAERFSHEKHSAIHHIAEAPSTALSWCYLGQKLIIHESSWLRDIKIDILPDRCLAYKTFSLCSLLPAVESNKRWDTARPNEILRNITMAPVLVVHSVPWMTYLADPDIIHMFIFICEWMNDTACIAFPVI